MYIDVVEPGATDTERTVWRFNLIVSYGLRRPQLDTVAKLVQTRKTKRHKWVLDPRLSFDPEDWRNRGKRPWPAPKELAHVAATQFADELRKAIDSTYAKAA
jgi:hypothetical protein